MVKAETIYRFLEMGIQAPSGENAQPWLFKIEHDGVLLFNNPESDQSLYNYNQAGSFVAHGALIENVVIAAEARGYETAVKYFPDPNAPNFVASLKFKEGRAKAHPLEPVIMLRATNRKPYDGTPLTAEEKRELADVPHLKEFPARLVMIEDREQMATLAHAASLNEQMLVLNRHVHDFFFSHVRWNEEENEKHPKGFYIDTLELKPPQVAAFKILRNWAFARVFGAVGISKLVRKDNETIYNTASAMIGVVAKKNTPLDLVTGGRILEHVWLTATKLGLSIQPMAGALFLAEGARGGNRDSFTLEQRNGLEETRHVIYETLGAHHVEEYVAIMVRIGRGGEPSARSARFPLNHFLI